jgi:hypothetical protein
MRDAANIDEAMRRVRAHHEAGLAAPIGHWVPTFRPWAVFLSLVFLNCMTYQGTGGRPRGGTDECASRPAVPSDVANNGARTRACCRTRTGRRVT